jgi:hypothetical protein
MSSSPGLPSLLVALAAISACAHKDADVLVHVKRGVLDSMVTLTVCDDGVGCAPGQPLFKIGQRETSVGIYFAAGDDTQNLRFAFQSAGPFYSCDEVSAPIGDGHVELSVELPILPSGTPTVTGCAGCSTSKCALSLDAGVP